MKNVHELPGSPRDTREVIEKRDCELISTCPFFNDEMHSEMTESLKEEFCHGNYTLRGRYLTYQALRNNEREKNPHRNSFKQNTDLRVTSRDKFTRL